MGIPSLSFDDVQSQPSQHQPPAHLTKARRRARPKARTAEAAPVAAPVEASERRELAAEAIATVQSTPASASVVDGGGSNASSDDRQCAICLDAESTHALVPCGHRCVCAVCAERALRSGQCPLCREPCDTALRVYV